MTYTFYVTIGVDTTEVFPLNFLESSLVDEQEQDEIFYRRKFNGKLMFCNLNGAMDFDLIYDAYVATPCDDIIFEIERSGIAYWNGKFAANDGFFDLDNYTFEVTPLPDDDYSIILDNAKNEYDIFSMGSEKTTKAYVNDSIDIDFTHCYRISDVIDYLCDAVMPGAIASYTFFDDATNYVTGTDNQLLHLLIAQKSDIIRPLSTDPALRAMISFEKLMDILWVMFQIKWNYSGGTFNVEHISFFTSGAGMNLTAQPLMARSNKFEYLKDKMPKYEKFNFMEASETNFVGLPIWYDSSCVNQDPKSNIVESYIDVTTDLEYIISDPTEISDDGFVILCNELRGADYYVKLTNGMIDDNVRLNMTLSWANLHNSYFRDNRILISGYLNNTLTTFWTAQKNIHQKCFAVVCPADSYDPSDAITTELGTTWLGGVNAGVMRSELSPSGEMAFDLIYGPADNVNTGVADNQNWIRIDQDDIGLFATLTNESDMIITITIEVTDCADTPEADVTWTIGAGEYYSVKSIAHKKIVSITTISGDWGIDFNPDPDYICAE